MIVYHYGVVLSIKRLGGANVMFSWIERRGKMVESSKITLLLQKHASGHREALDELIPLVYEKMQAMAKYRLQGEKDDHTINTTALVHEAYLKLVDFDRIEWQNRDHFFGIASQVMRNILVDYAIKQQAQKRGGKQQRVTLGEADCVTELNLEDVLTVHQLLEKLEKIDERQVRVVECRFFGCLTIEETAKALNISTATVSRDWNMARAWLNRELESFQ
ncbi:RNA polymerase subunit sigma-70 [Rhodohalobacter barkolensis]|uniref:RNA polymerase subunit sigma-70 n=2 Tax=Rhodohalobacter barkolensis TaxID=2053187 RepID=A0A2N0VIW9_9BACT|nr:RNA polymerase subunit sigma-70 [Rhodohalobacter barkolensis]